MSIKLRRYISDKSNFLSTDPAPLTSVTIPGSIGFTDLTQSRVVLDMEIHAYEPTLAPSGGNFCDPTTEVKIPCTFGRGGQMIGAQSTIRNSKVRSRNFGLLNEQRNQNVISANFDWYTKSRAKEDTACTFGNSTSKNYGIGWTDLLPETPFFSYDGARPVDTSQIADRLGSTRRAEIPIPWKHIDQLATIAQFPNIAVGDIRYEIEFENQLPFAFPCVMPTQYERIQDITSMGGEAGNDTNPLITRRTGTNINRLPKVGDYAVFYFEEAGTASFHVANINKVTGSDSTFLSIELDSPITTSGPSDDLTKMRMFYGEVTYPLYNVSNMNSDASGFIGTVDDPLVMTGIYDSSNSLADQQQCPWYVGAPITVVATVAGQVKDAATTVASLQRDGNNLKIVLAAPLDADAAATQVSNILAVHRDFSEISNSKYVIQWRINELYAEMLEPQLTAQQLTQVRSRLADLELPWIETRLIQKNMPTTTTHTEVIQVDSGCIGMTTLSPQNLEFLSGFDSCQSYRYAINGVATTNRDIQVGAIDRTQRQLHNHLLKKFYGNLGVPLMKYDADVTDYARPDDKRTHSHYPLVTPLIPAPQTVQLQLFGDPDTPMISKNLFFVSIHPRMMKLSNGRVQMAMAPMSAG